MVNWGFREYWFLKLFPFPNLDNLLNSEKLYEIFFSPPTQWPKFMSCGVNDQPKMMSLPQTMFLSSLEKIVWAVFEVIRGGGESHFFRKKCRSPLVADIDVLWGERPSENDIPTPTIIPSNLKKIVWAIFEVIKGGGVPFFSKKIGARYWQILMSGGENDHPKIMSLPQTMFLSSLEKIVWAVFEVIRGGPIFSKKQIKKIGAPYWPILMSCGENNTQKWCPYPKL